MYYPPLGSQVWFRGDGLSYSPPAYNAVNYRYPVLGELSTPVEINTTITGTVGFAGIIDAAIDSGIFAPVIVMATTVTGVLTADSVDFLLPAMTGEVYVCGGLLANVPITCTASGAGMIEGSFESTVEVSGVLSGAGAVVGVLAVALDISGIALGSVRVEGVLSSSVPISCTATGGTDLRGVFEGSVELSAVFAGNVPPCGPLLATVVISWQAAGVRGVAGTVAAEVPLTMAATASAGATGSLSETIQISCTATGAHGIGGEFSGLIDIVGDFDGLYLLPVSGYFLGGITIAGTIYGETPIHYDDTDICVFVMTRVREQSAYTQ